MSRLFLLSGVATALIGLFTLDIGTFLYSIPLYFVGISIGVAQCSKY